MSFMKWRAAKEVVPTDDTAIDDSPYRRVTANIGGDVKVYRSNGTYDTFVVTAGQWFEAGQFIGVESTGTTASGIVVS